jgi:hypothetical protein
MWIARSLKNTLRTRAYTSALAQCAHFVITAKHCHRQQRKKNLMKCMVAKTRLLIRAHASGGWKFCKRGLLLVPAAEQP